MSLSRSVFSVLPRVSRAQYARPALRTSAAPPLIERRAYATGYEQRTQAALKTSSKLTWITTLTALAAFLYYSSSSPSPTSSSSPAPPSSSASSSSPSASKIKADLGFEAPKPVEDRHGDSVSKHAMAAHKNEQRVRKGVFSGKEFDNHDTKHSADPGRDFEERK